MLLFCEECGGRNVITDTDDNMMTVRFRCVACDYENVWQKPQESGKTEKQNKPMSGGGKTGHGCAAKKG